MVGGTQGLKSRNKGHSSSNADSPSKNIKSKPNINRKPKRCGLKLVIVSSVFFLGLVKLLHQFYFKRSSSDSRDSLRRLITPAPLPKLTDLPMFQGEHRESLYWGTYRSHLYFGVRARTPKSLMLGLMWLGVKDGRYALRHTCEMSDGLNSYSWIRHDGRNFGQQVIEDQGFSIDTMFLKRRSSTSGYGGDWAVRIEVHNDRFSEEESLKDGHIFFYIADEAGHPLKLGKGVSKFISNQPVVSGHREDVRGWEVHCQGMDDVQIHYAGYSTLHFHNMTDVVQQTLATEIMKTRSLQLPDIVEDNSNIMVFQVSRKIPFKLDLVFVSGISSANDLVNERVQTLSGTTLTNLIKEYEDNFERHFEMTFGLTEKVDKELVNVGKAALSSLIGGIGYFYGQSRIAIPKEYKDVTDRDYALYWPAPLYTAVPSRSFFPRGFLWDEGFHQLLIWRWDISICLDIIGHWLDLMNLDGWIPREQILGTEALRKVPEEFVIQNPTNANPPTLFLALHDLASELTKNSWTAMERESIKSFLQRAFPRLDMWFHWFNATQAGKVATSFYWHGRDNITNSELNPKTLSSGLDDYPRASHPSDDERHLDLRCWMALAADCMYQISKEVTSVNHDYWKTALQLKDLNILNQMHYDNFSGMYHDFGNHTEKASLKWIELHDTKSYSIRRELRRVVGDVPVLRLVPHFGYVSLFPLIMKIIPSESPVLKTQLDLISNRSLLWTNFGLRSLARTSSSYMKRNTEHDAPYWRGPVWININYLVLSALNHYAKEDGPYSSTALDIYSRLRHNLIRNIADNYNRTGYFWEQYDNAASGKGKGAHPFTGWTSLIVLMMAEKY